SGLRGAFVVGRFSTEGLPASPACGIERDIIDPRPLLLAGAPGRTAADSGRALPLGIEGLALLSGDAGLPKPPGFPNPPCGRPIFDTLLRATVGRAKLRDGGATDALVPPITAVLLGRASIA